MNNLRFYTIGHQALVAHHADIPHHLYTVYPGDA